jgi:hypothetical protein
MDIILTLFAMSATAPLFEAPKMPEAAIVQVYKMDAVDVYHNMLDPDWINQNREHAHE